jgi:hypothetical protein
LETNIGKVNNANNDTINIGNILVQSQNINPRRFIAHMPNAIESKSIIIVIPRKRRKNVTRPILCSTLSEKYRSFVQNLITFVSKIRELIIKVHKLY